MGVLRALLRKGGSVRRNRYAKTGLRDPRRRFVRENRINFESLEARVVLANTSAEGAFSVLLDNAPGDVNGFDGNLALYQSGLVYNSKTVSDAVVQFAGTLHPVNGNKPTSVSAVFSFDGQTAQTYYWSVDAGANINDQVLFRVPVLSDPLATGGYAWSVDVTYHYFGNMYSPTGTQDYSGVYSHVDRSGSEFGKGWYLEELHELKLVNPKTNGGKVYLITGDGEPTRFDYNGSVYAREAGDQFFYAVTRDDPVLPCRLSQNLCLAA
jgi:hypothetical protein